MPTSDLKIAAAYIRVSTDDQEEYSPDSQVRLIREYARKNGYLLPEEYVFQDDGISAATARKRPAFNRMIALAKEKERPFDAILVLMFSRFARNREESVLYKGLLRKQGISVISVKEPAVDGPFGTLIESIIEWFDEYYLINLSAEVKRGMSEKFLRGEAMGTAPFGYRIDSANKTFTVDPERAEIVCDVFRSYADGAGLRDIAVQLGDAGITTRRGNRPDNRFVEYMLRNPRIHREDPLDARTQNPVFPRTYSGRRGGCGRQAPADRLHGPVGGCAAPHGSAQGGLREVPASGSRCLDDAGPGALQRLRSHADHGRPRLLLPLSPVPQLRQGRVSHVPFLIPAEGQRRRAGGPAALCGYADLPYGPPPDVRPVPYRRLWPSAGAGAPKAGPLQGCLPGRRRYSGGIPRQQGAVGGAYPPHRRTGRFSCCGPGILR